MQNPNDCSPIGASVDAAGGSLSACTPEATSLPPIAGQEGKHISLTLDEVRDALPGLRQHGVEGFARQVKHALAGERLIKEIVSRTSMAREPFPNGAAWDPRRAIVQWDRSGNKEEATWLAFLTTHFSSGAKEDPWYSVRSFYSGFGEKPLTWDLISTNPSKIEELRKRHVTNFQRLRFGNHRKYESQEQLGAVIASYIKLVKRESGGSQVEMFLGNGRSGRPSFSDLMGTLDHVFRFARLGSFDMLCLLGNLGVYNLTPDRLYLDGATGPLTGARALFGEADPSELDGQACRLADRLRVSYQVMEDSLCNWQKSF